MLDTRKCTIFAIIPLLSNQIHRERTHLRSAADTLVFNSTQMLTQQRQQQTVAGAAGDIVSMVSPPLLCLFKSGLSKNEVAP